MMDIDIVVDWKEADRMLKKFDGAMDSATRFMLNWMAVKAVRSMKKSLHREFIIRNKWSENSIYPREKFGSKASGYGFVPLSKNHWPTMYSQAGTVSEYLADQETGFTRKDPYVPTDFARINKSPTRIITKKAKLPILRKAKMLKPSSMTKPSTREEKIRAMLGMVSRMKYKGFINIDDENDVLPMGMYRAGEYARKGKAQKIKGRRRTGTLRLWRLYQKGPQRRSPKKWFSKSISIMQKDLSYTVVNQKWIHVLDKYCHFMARR